MRCISRDLHFAQARFDHLQVHDPAIQLLFRQNHLDEAEAALPISVFERGDRALNGSEVALLASKSGQQSLYGSGTQ